MKFREYIEKTDESALGYAAGLVAMGIKATWSDLIDKTSKDDAKSEIVEIEKAKTKKDLKTVMKKIVGGGKKYSAKGVEGMKNALGSAAYALGSVAMTVRGIKNFW